MRSVPSGTLSMRAIDADDADLVEVVGRRASRARGRLEATMTSMRLPLSASLTSAHRALLADGQRRQRVRERDGLAQRQDGQRRRAPRARRRLDVVAGRRR